MKKEVLFAIAAGLGIGVTIAFGVWRANSALTNELPKDSSQMEIISDVVENIEDSIFTEYENLDVVTEETITLSGLTQPNKWIIVSSEEADYILKSDTTGKFEQEITLQSGLNTIVITAFSDDSSVEKQLLLVYSSQFGENENES